LIACPSAEGLLGKSKEMWLSRLNNGHLARKSGSLVRRELG
jgi:hypothetical protein